MTQQQANKLLKEAIDHGVDISMLKERLQLTPTQRLEFHQRALSLVEELRRAKPVNRDAANS